MPGLQIPGAQCGSKSNGLNQGTLVLMNTPCPVSVGLQPAVNQRPLTQRLERAIRGAAGRLPSEAGAALMGLLSPQALATLAAVLAVWAASHAVGVGEVADLLLLATGLAFVGWEALEGFSHLGQFVQGVMAAHSDQELDVASDHLAKAVTSLGVATVMALLLRGGGRAARAERYKPKVTGDPALPAGYGETTKYGDRAGSAGLNTQRPEISGLAAV